jgi:hypothetical protein
LLEKWSDFALFRVLPDSFISVITSLTYFLISSDSNVGVSEGNSSAVADGYYVITEPLAKGNYVIGYKSSLICPAVDCLQPSFAQDLTYNLIVE